MLHHRDLTIRALLSAFGGRMSLTWLLVLLETGLMALIPLFIGFAIDGLQTGALHELLKLSALMTALILIAVMRRLYDTRVYGTVRVELGQTQVARSTGLSVSALNARLGMGRELVDFLEQALPEVMAALVQLTIAVLVLSAYSSTLAIASASAVVTMTSIYALFHGRFFRLNGLLNHQVEHQVGILEEGDAERLRGHLLQLRNHEVRLSDTEAALYGTIFLVLLGLILFNLWYTVTELTTTVGTIFAIISYSWEYVASASAMPIVWQHWARLSEIMQRLNEGDRSDPA